MYRPLATETKSDLLMAIKFTDDLKYGFQKARIRIDNQIDSLERRSLHVQNCVREMAERMHHEEDEAEKMIKDVVSRHPMWPCFFEPIKGISYALSGSLLAQLKDIGRFGTVSKLWAYVGYVGSYFVAECTAKGDKKHKLIMSSDNRKECPVLVDDKGNKCGCEIKIIEKVEGKTPKRKTEHHFLFNTKAKTICYKISEQFIRGKNTHYTKYYYREKERLNNLDLKLSKLAIDMKARRKMMKIFLAHLWEAAMLLEGVAFRPPYVVEKLGHTGWERWADMLRLIRSEEEKIKKAKSKTKEPKEEKKKAA